MGQYTLDNTGGKINNMGTIKVKNGQTKALPDTIGGRVEFLQKSISSQQMIPNIVYNQLVIANDALKLISDERKDGDAVRSMVVRDSLIIENQANFTSRWIGLKSEEVHAKSSVTNTARYTNGKDLVLSGEEKAQDLLGNGSYTRIRVENKFGADVRGGGFTIEEQLTLKEGELRNNTDNNFTILDSSLIVRHVGGSIAHEPILENRISVHYLGDGSLTTGAEIPQSETALKNMRVNVSQSLSLDRNVYVVDSLEVGAYISAVNDTLILQGEINPDFTGGPSAEIDGNFRRNTLLTADTILLNNPYTWAYFPTEISKGGATSLVSTIRPLTFHELPAGDEKVRRSYVLWGLDPQGRQIEDGIAMNFGFGFRHLPNQTQDESNDLVPAEVILQRWINEQWLDIEPKSTEPQVDFGTGWASGMIEELNNFGVFALGMPGSTKYFYTFRASLYLEGPYRIGSRGFMTHDLWDRDLIAQADLTAYPTNLDLALTPDFLTQIPDSVVDIVVLEFRKERNAAPTFIKTGYLRYDGVFVDRFGSPEIRIDSLDGIAPQGGRFHVAVRHRNHSAVITEEPVEINNTTRELVYNLSDPSIVEGGAAALRLVYVDYDGNKIFALKGGFLADDAQGLSGQMNFLNNYTRDFEHRSAFLGFTREGYLNSDFNLSGIINTKDFNISWNNRGLK
ncbi:MAG: hypothetical protein KIT33_09925 [Candidatus Kapabacteria bacterium]|nr:hypothetical protein [Candidatus Kapabacteria bacterium]